MLNISINDRVKKVELVNSHICFLNAKKEMYRDQRKFYQEQINLLLSEENNLKQN